MRRAQLGLILALMLLAGPAAAHKMRIFATVEGLAITGYAYFSPGGRVQGASVTLADAAGESLAQGETDSDGRFRFTVPRPDEYRLTVGGQDGHAAFFAIRAAEFSATHDPIPAPTAGAAPAPGSPPDSLLPAAPELARMIDTSLARQIAPLRADLDAFANKIFWHDVLGGLGYILGLGGLYYGMTARRRQGGA